MNITPWSLLTESISDFRRTWPQLVLTDLLARTLAVVIIAPAVGLLGKLFLWRTATGVVTDEAIVSFLLHPFGMAALVVIAAVSLGVLFAETGQLMVIGFGAVQDRHLTWLDALLYAYRRAAALVHLAGAGVVRLLLISVPFLVAGGGVYWLLVRTHDINYYLARKPPEFMAAVVGVGFLLAVLGLIVVSKIASWLLALPMVLFERMGGKQALQTSDAITRTHRRKLTLWLLWWLALTALLSTAVTTVVGWLGGLVVSLGVSNLGFFLIGLSLVIVAAGIANLAVSVFTTVLFPLLVLRVYRSIAGPGELRPEIGAPGSLTGRAVLRVPGKIVLAAGIAAAVLAVVGFTMAVDDPDWEDPTQIIAHRGGAAVAPENTMAAFERGIADGADWLELDVQENADGTVVVEHDRDFMRAAGVRLEVWEATDTDLANIDIGSSFAPEFADQRVPTLREVLELAKGRVGVFIELKYYGHDVSLEEKVVELVEETGTTGHIVIMSLNYDGVRRTATLRPDWTYGLLNAVAIGDLTRLDVDFLALTAKTTTVPMIRRTHRRGMETYPWTINDPVQMWVMMSRGVDGIITDRVALANHIKQLRAEVTPVGRFIIWIAGEVGLLRGMDETSSEENA
ncbi:MAG: glycerophosphoryl diester phosphodiesterase membrane domain-containing protein [Thermoanaerobaculales bacterium]|nr:glycerophosphoryl diester phosphodiesterase membrane domain-containing protein [Thermoanaerobaculales bacterium]